MAVPPPNLDPEQARYMADLEARKAKFKDKNDVPTRVFGGVLILIGIGVGYWEVVRPILQALKGVDYVSYTQGAACAAVGGILGGLALLIFGSSGTQALEGPPQKSKIKKLTTVILLVVAVILGIACFFGTDVIMWFLGYR